MFKFKLFVEGEQQNSHLDKCYVLVETSDDADAVVSKDKHVIDGRDCFRTVDEAVQSLVCNYVDLVACSENGVSKADTEVRPGKSKNNIDGILGPLKKAREIYSFKDKPILVGGGAMQYYGLRETGHDLDVVISGRDKEGIKALRDKDGRPYKLNLFGGKDENDIDATFTNFAKLKIDLIVSLDQIKYDVWRKNAVKYNDDLLVIGLKDLLKQKKLAVKYSNMAKQKRDVELIESKTNL